MFFDKQSVLYQRLPPSERPRFRSRVVLFMEAHEFMAKGMEEVPPDVKAAIAASAVHLTLGLDAFIFKKYEHIIVYPHPFPSPQHPEKWHASEIFEEDGVVLFSAEQLMAGFLQPARYFNLGLYEYARVFYRTCAEASMLPSFYEDDWEKLEQISGFSREIIEKWVGLPEIETRAVAVAHFFVFPHTFRQVMPEQYVAMAAVFRQN
jgi:hypothetical protein